ncbi:MAG: hypothetical protein E3J28_02150 [Desulfobacteraceae bacterium]|jgi:hypothetical protein|nr:MAG: hypothetical protein E3J28_02150 [Desulfobacteraceae bacterium]
MKRGIFISGLVISIVILLSLQVMAQGGKINIGKIKVVPGITVQELYDDNIFLGNGTNNTTELKESDWITHIMPALVFDYSFQERGGLSLGYSGDLAYYSDNDNNDWQTHKGMFNLNYKAPGGIIIDINIIHTDAEDPYGSLEGYGRGLKTERSSNDLKTRICYDFGNRFKILAYYNYYKQDYDLPEDFTQDYDINEFGAGFQVRLLPKTWGFFRYHFGERYYFTHRGKVTEANDSDFDWHRVNAGLTWDPGAKLGGELNFGYQLKDYENATDVGGNRYEDKDTWIAETSITYSATPTIALALRITRAMRETGSDYNEYFEDTGIGINLQKVILTKFTLTVGGVYSVNDYNTPREDDNYRANIDLDYQIKDWLTAGVGYRYEKKDSNYAENNYTDNQFMISLRGVY